MTNAQPESKRPYFEYGFWWWWNDKLDGWFIGPSPFYVGWPE